MSLLLELLYSGAQPNAIWKVNLICGGPPSTLPTRASQRWGSQTKLRCGGHKGYLTALKHSEQQRGR